MTQHDTILCRLRVARWKAWEAQATFDCILAAQRGDKEARAASEVWAEICALRAQAWQEEAAHG